MPVTKATKERRSAATGFVPARRSGAVYGSSLGGKPAGGEAAKGRPAGEARKGRVGGTGKVPPVGLGKAKLAGKAAAKDRSARTEPLGAVVAGFVRAADELGLSVTLAKLRDPESFGADLARVAATRATLEAATGGYVSVAEAAKIIGVNSRQAVHQRIDRGTLLAMDVAGQTVLPAYQFDGPRARPEVTRAAKLLAPAGLSDIGVVSWFATPQPELDGVTPAAWLASGSDAARVYEAARHTAGALAH